MNLDDTRRATIKIGDDAGTFLNTDVGKYLLGCANQDIEAYRDSLERIDLNAEGAVERLKTLQERSMAARMIKSYLTEAFENSTAAEHSLAEEYE